MFHYIYGGILGLIQGLTEFLPISSSGHLFVAQFLSNKFFNNTQYLTPFTNDTMPLLYVALLHIATLCATLLFTHTIIRKMLKASVQFCVTKVIKRHQGNEERTYVHLTCMICLSTFTTLPIGLLLKNTVVNASLNIVIMGFFITAFLLCLPSLIEVQRNTGVDAFPQSGENMRISVSQAICIGIIQGCAVLPGISRSGSTIVVGILLGLSFVHAAYFSFLIAIPAILASFISSALEVSSPIAQSVPLSFTLVSTVSAFLSGLVGLTWIIGLTKRKKLWIFSLYLFSLNIVLLFLNHV